MRSEERGADVLTSECAGRLVAVDCNVLAFVAVDCGLAVLVVHLLVGQRPGGRPDVPAVVSASSAPGLPGHQLAGGAEPRT